jgi:hypothetical protein
LIGTIGQFDGVSPRFSPFMITNSACMIAHVHALALHGDCVCIDTAVAICEGDR